MPKIVTIVGARPQFVKAAVVSRLLPAHCSEVIVHTGQHYDYELSDSFFEELAIPKPAYNLGIGSGSHAQQTGEMLIALEKVLLTEQPNLVLLYGDTNSTLAGTLAAVKLGLPIAHVEAGARNFDLSLPEEINRLVTDRLSTLLFCATSSSVINLANEGLRQGVFLTGDVMLDLHLAKQPVVRETSTVLADLQLQPGQYILATIHRDRNTDVDDRLQAIFEAFLSMSETVVLPLHPRAVKNLKRIGLYDRLAAAPHLRLTKPQGYLDFVRLELDARLIITDSGGVQREAYFCQRPCLTVFDNTPWPETVEDGWNRLVEANTAKILTEVTHFQPAGPQRRIFGDGRAGEAIVHHILNYFGGVGP